MAVGYSYNYIKERKVKVRMSVGTKENNPACTGLFSYASLVPISRILYPSHAMHVRDDSYLSGPDVTVGIKRHSEHL